MFELIGICTLIALNSAVSCAISITVWNVGFGPEGMRFRSRGTGYAFAVTAGAFWPVSLFILLTSKKSAKDAEPPTETP